MLTNIDKNTPEENVHLHNQVLEFLKDNLAYGYVSEAKKRLLEKGIEISSGMIRQIKNGERTNWTVLEVLTEMANETEARKSVSEI